jgi:hypothetical protein
MHGTCRVQMTVVWPSLQSNFPRAYRYGGQAHRLADRRGGDFPANQRTQRLQPRDLVFGHVISFVPGPECVEPVAACAP